MTNSIIFHNPGSLDIRGATTMGLSAKDTSSAIGKFGTGLKYAIASILRWGGAVSIEISGKKYHFHKREIVFRDKAHDQILMVSEDGVAQELGYTTHYGHHWQPWEIFRELYSNARDEHGGVVKGHVPVDYDGDYTLIRVTCAEIAGCYAERDTILLTYEGDTTALDNVKVAKVPSSFIFYKGVRVLKHKALATWNVTDDLELTEDRTLKDDFYYKNYCAQAVQQSKDSDWIAKILLASDAYFESDFGYDAWAETSQEFINAAFTIYKQHGVKALPAGVMNIIRKQFPEVDAPVPHVLTKVQEQQLASAREFLRQIGMPVDEYPLEVVKFQKNVLGQAKDGKVLLSPAVFEQGTKQVVSTWYEELVHLSTGLRDNCYEMQTYLFNRIISLHEELLGKAI